MRDFVVLHVNGVRREIRGGDAFLSLSDYLRMSCGLVGTKIVCSEGDCGACSVLVGRANAERSEFVYRPVDSCIQFLFQLDGAHVVTVEGLADEGELNPVQQAMIDCHGSQCGFCTPGFVVAMTGLLDDPETPLDADAWKAGLTGNLCRCTGYVSIVEAGLAAAKCEQRSIGERYPVAETIESIAAGSDESLEIEAVASCDGAHHRVACPTTLEDAVKVLAAHPKATIVAGATDVGVRANKSHALPAEILDLNRVRELDFVRVEDGMLTAGCRATWTSLLDACRDEIPEFARILEIFGAPQIRHVGTIGGNIANASPIADSLPFLYVMDAVLELASAAGRRDVSINAFYRGYKQLDMRPGELIAAVRIPLPAVDELLRLYNVSRRRDLDISGFTAAVRMTLDGDTISSARIAMGAVGPTVLQATKTEQFLVGKALTEETMRAAGDIAVAEITPISDVRGSADYRRQLARNVLVKFYHQTRGELAPA